MFERERDMGLFTMVTRLLHGIMKVAGLTPQTLEIDPDTLMNIWVPTQTISKVQADGKPQHLPPKKPAVLLLHCFAMDGIFLWFPQVLALTRDYSVYVPDLLFFGGSTTSRSERSVRFQADFLAKGMEMLGVEKVSVVGLSYGGIVGLEMAKWYPNLVQSIVVSSAVDVLTDSLNGELCKQFGASCFGDLLLPETVEGFKKMLAVGAHKLPWIIPDFIYRGIFETMFHHRKERSELLEALVVPDEDAITKPNYSQRILMLWGDDDKIFNLELARIIKTRLGAKTSLKYIKDAGHLLSLEQPFAYNRSLKHFLQTSKYTN